MKHIIDKNYFPGWVRKSVSFTIDDGNIEMDKKFLDIVRPAGILGTFNLCGVSALAPDEYRKMYKGYEIANHVKAHPRIFAPGEKDKLPLSEEPFDRETADTAVFYRHPEISGVWFFHGSYYNPGAYGDKKKWWFRITDPDTYIKLIDETHRELEDVFGRGSVRSFAWPFGQQVDCKNILSHVAKIGYYGARSAGSPGNGFSLPADRLTWKYCATHSELLSKMNAYASIPDDGELKFFSFGVHSIDYEHSQKWDDLKKFCEKYGNRTDEYFYGTVGQIFDYEDAIKALVITDTEIVNSSLLTMYIKIDGTPVTVAPKSIYKI